MQKTSLIILFTFLILRFLNAQEERIISINLFPLSYDTLEVTDFDTSKIHDNTNFHTGLFNNLYNSLDNSLPDTNLFSDSNFSIKKQVSLDYDIEKFPIRTSVKLFKVRNDSLNNSCSGSMISRKHIFTACHCVRNPISDMLTLDSLLICPVYDNGELNGNFECSWVKKIFHFENWDLFSSDFAILELEKPIGEKTGWVSIGYNSNDSLLSDGVFYKFSYPSITMLEIDTNNFNGDTLYYNYGQIDIVNEDNLGVNNTDALPGESGSTIIKIKNNEEYISYGVLSLAHNLYHSRLKQWHFYGFKSIIQNDLSLSTENIDNNDTIEVFPNPSSGTINLKFISNKNIGLVKVFSIRGTKVHEEYINSNFGVLDLTSLSSSTYFILVNTGNEIYYSKIIKD